MARGGIPHRWLDYYPVGKQVAGTRFIAFKVPLKEALCRELSLQDRFTPWSLIEQVPQLGLVVDLTNTRRYYSHQDLETQGVAYQKVLCPGHVIPPKGLVHRFYSIVDNHINQNPDPGSLIGVHCTHGLNRTSFFICSYMIERMGMVPQDALTAFQNARGYSVERENYIEELFTLKPFSAPCPENSDVPRQQMSHAIQQSSNKRKPHPCEFQPQTHFKQDSRKFQYRGPSHSNAPQHQYGHYQKKQYSHRYEDWNTHDRSHPQVFSHFSGGVEQCQEFNASNSSDNRRSADHHSAALQGRTFNNFGSGENGEMAHGFHDLTDQHTPAVKYRNFGNKSWVLKSDKSPDQYRNSNSYNKDNSQRRLMTKNRNGVTNGRKDESQACQFHPKSSKLLKVGPNLSASDCTAQSYPNSNAYNVYRSSKIQS